MKLSYAYSWSVELFKLIEFYIAIYYLQLLKMYRITECGYIIVFSIKICSFSKISSKFI